jgi:beta-N-acetylhexosaminidase
MQKQLPIIFGIAGPSLSADETQFFKTNPVRGIILFARNIVDRPQLLALTASIRALLGPDVWIAIDQEGGRVARLRPPLFPAYPPARQLAENYVADPKATTALVRDNYFRIGQGLAELGINVDCAPVLDIPIPGAHDVIGDRAFGTEPGIVAALGLAACDGLRAAGVLPVIKHIPGHGRSMVDSHHDLPTVDTDYATLCATDFAPFRALADQPLAMTAHIVYRAIDPEQPITLSVKGIERVIRGEIGFRGELMSDDLGMKALRGELGDLALRTLAAGCDIVLHCSGVMDEMRRIVAAIAAKDGDYGIRSARAMG